MSVKVMKKISSFTVNSFDKNALIPFDETDHDRPFKANVITNQGYSGLITRIAECIQQPNGKYQFPVEITYLEGSKKGKKKQAMVMNYSPTGRYGELFR